MGDDFSDRVLIVSGGTGALGAAVVSRFVGAGGVCHIPVLEASEVEHFPYKEYGNVRLAEGIDLTNEGAAEAFYRAVPGRLWASIHLAGGFAMGPIEEAGADAFQRMMDINARTCYVCCRQAVRAMRAGGKGGRIVNVAARPALSPEQGAQMVAYAAAKSAVAAMTQALAAEVAADGILVNAVAPSVLDTPANRRAMPKADHAAWPKVEEVGAVIAMLASPGNRLASGAVVPVYGRV